MSSINPRQDRRANPLRPPIRPPSAAPPVHGAGPPLKRLGLGSGSRSLPFSLVPTRYLVTVTAIAAPPPPPTTTAQHSTPPPGPGPAPRPLLTPQSPTRHRQAPPLRTDQPKARPSRARGLWSAVLKHCPAALARAVPRTRLATANSQKPSAICAQDHHGSCPPWPGLLKLPILWPSERRVSAAAATALIPASRDGLLAAAPGSSLPGAVHRHAS